MRNLLMTAVVGMVGLWANQSQAAQWAAKQGEVSYKLVHKMHEVEGKSVKVEVVAVVDATGLKLMARAPVTTFDSGNGNRDAHMLEVVEGAKFPLVVIKAAVPGFVPPTTPGKVKIPVTAEIEFHGVKVAKSFELEVELKDATTAVATFAFPVSLTAHKIERPSLLFIPVDDDVTITGSITMELKP